MSFTTINQLAIGQVGVSPAQFYLKTDLTNSQLQAADFLNSISATNGSIPADKDFVLAAASDGSEYYVVNGKTLIPAGGSSGGFQYENTIFVAQNGDDLNNGRSDLSPKQTLAGAFAAINSAGVWAVNILDAGTYNAQVVTSAVDPSTVNVIVNGPAATISNTANLELFDPALKVLVVYARYCVSATGPAVIEVGAQNLHMYYVDIINGSIVVNTDLSRLYINVNILENSTISTPGGADLYINCLQADGVVVLNPENVNGRVGTRTYPTSCSSIFRTVSATSGTVDAVVGTKYLALNTGLLQTFNFPDNTSTPPPVIGDEIRINGVSSSPWVAVFGPGVSCFYGNVACAPGGNISATAPTDIAQFSYIQNNVWTVDFSNPGSTLVPSIGP